MATIVELVGVSHGILGILLLFAIILSLISLVSPFRKRITLLNTSSFLAFLASLLINLVGDFMYGVYRASVPTSARSIIKAGSSPWVHTILMELKEHIAHFVPVLLAVALILIFHYEREVFKRPEIKKSVAMFFVLALIWSFTVMFMGVFITSVQPIK